MSRYSCLEALATSSPVHGKKQTSAGVADDTFRQPEIREGSEEEKRMPGDVYFERGRLTPQERRKLPAGKKGVCDGEITDSRTELPDTCQKKPIRIYVCIHVSFESTNLSVCLSLCLAGWPCRGPVCIGRVLSEPQEPRRGERAGPYLDLLTRRGGRAVLDVILDRVIEKNHVLWNNAYVLSDKQQEEKNSSTRTDGEREEEEEPRLEESPAREAEREEKGRAASCTQLANLTRACTRLYLSIARFSAERKFRSSSWSASLVAVFIFLGERKERKTGRQEGRGGRERERSERTLRLRRKET